MLSQEDSLLHFILRAVVLVVVPSGSLLSFFQARLVGANQGFREPSPRRRALVLSETLSRLGESHSPKRGGGKALGRCCGLAQARDLSFGRRVVSLSEGSWLERDPLQVGWLSLIVCNSLESLGETSGVALQWSGRNSMTLVSGCSWWCPISMLGGEQLGGEQRYPPQVQASAESDQTIRIRMSRVRV
ncbi:hypothetical protein DEO72_LG10g2286 [Vigna unguiculata]|uniref:Uncharacterized protein n=1 Tax=Vigna unguiculata TaxID=3917 RepID=A0A4D6NB62_VIGUN|nr:hypothetical protein DEO72_LG10g2286 [Vigna unguiculata]